MSGMVRLDKFLADRNLGTRSQIKEMARKGRISVNGQVQKNSDQKVDPSADRVSLDGKSIEPGEDFQYLMLCKPQGVVSATRDNLHPTVLDLLGPEARRDLFPVGRLDIDTEGLLLLTNDGDLAHRLLSPRKHVDKTYYVEADGTFSADARERLEKGIVLTDGTVSMPARVEEVSAGPEGVSLYLTIQEGKFHQVKRMMEALNCRVVFLKRLSMGTLQLDGQLQPGQYRPLTASELSKLKDGI